MRCLGARSAARMAPSRKPWIALEDLAHQFSGCSWVPWARCLYLSAETSVKSEWKVPAREASWRTDSTGASDPPSTRLLTRTLQWSPTGGDDLAGLAAWPRRSGHEGIACVCPCTSRICTKIGAVPRCSNFVAHGPHVFSVTHSRKRATGKDVGSQVRPDTSGRSLRISERVRSARIARRYALCDRELRRLAAMTPMGAGFKPRVLKATNDLSRPFSERKRTHNRGQGSVAAGATHGS
jgi:hypothetical protein